MDVIYILSLQFDLFRGKTPIDTNYYKNATWKNAMMEQLQKVTFLTFIDLLYSVFVECALFAVVVFNWSFIWHSSLSKRIFGISNLTTGM